MALRPIDIENIFWIKNHKMAAREGTTKG